MLDLKRTIENSIYDIKSDHIQNVNSPEIKYQRSHQSTSPYIINPFQQTAASGQHNKQSKKQFILSKTQLFIHQNHHNQMSNSIKFLWTG